MPSDEKALIERAQAGDRAALGELLAAHQRVCYGLALRLTRNSDEAEDVCQDAFVRASRDIAAYRPIGGFRSWLFKLVARSYGHRAESEAARRRRERERAMEAAVGETDEKDGIGEAERTELRRDLDLALGRLDENRRVPIVLHCECGMTCAEAAAVLQMPEGTVKANIRRGLEELKGLMTRAGYGATIAGAGALEAVLAQQSAAAAPAVPAGLTAFIQSLTAAAGESAAVVGKAAAGAALRISARLSAKKAAGLALGWKLGTVLTAAAIGGAAVMAMKSGMFQERTPAPVAVAPEGTKLPPLPASDYVQGPIIFEDNFDQGLGNWELLVGDDTGHLVPAGDKADVIAASFRRLSGLSKLGVPPNAPRNMTKLTTGESGSGHSWICLRARTPTTEDAFSITCYVMDANARGFEAPFPLVREADVTRKSGVGSLRYPTNYWARWDCVPVGRSADGTPLVEVRLCGKAFLQNVDNWGADFDGRKVIETRLIACRDRRIGLMLGDGTMSIGRIEVRRLEKRPAGGGAQ